MFPSHAGRPILLQILLSGLIVLLAQPLVAQSAMGAADTTAILSLLKATDSHAVRNREKARNIAESALQYSAKAGYAKGQGLALVKLAAFASDGNLPKGLSLFHQALPYLRQAGEHQWVLNTMATISEFYEHLGRLDSSIYFTLESIRVQQNVFPHDPPVWPYTKLGSLFFNIGEYETARSYAAKALALSAIQDKSEFTQQQALNVLCKVFTQKGRPDSSLYYANYFGSKLSDSTELQALVPMFTNKVRAFVALNQNDSALYYAAPLEKLLWRNGIYFADRLEAAMQLSDAYAMANDYDAALLPLAKLLKFPEARTYVVYQQALYDRFADIYFHLQNYRQAWLYKDSASIVSRKMNTSRNAFLLRQAETRYRTAEKDNELARQQLSLAQSKADLATKDLQIALAIAGVFIAVVVALFLRRYYRQNQRLQKLQIQSLKQENEMKVLKSQIEPHFLFNTLNSISASVPASLENTREMIAQLADTFRYGLATSERKVVRLEEEMNFIKTWLSLEKARLGSRLEVVFDIDERCLDFNIPPMLLQPLIENALEHGIGPRVQGGMVRIECKKEASHICMAVSDTGVGYAGELQDIFAKGIGVSNIARRLKLLFNETLMVERGDEGLKFWFKVPTSTDLLPATNPIMNFQ